MNDALEQYLHSHIQCMRDDVLSGFVNEIKNEYSTAVVAILFYGSCMRTGEYKGAVLDFYVIVDDYANTYESRWYRWANSLLPPNVFYLQTNVGNQAYRAKYAVISQQALADKVSAGAFHPYFWARFAQPFSYLYLRDDNDRQWLAWMQATSINTFTQKVIAACARDITSEEFWETGFKLTYSSELRTEPKDRASSIYLANRCFYDEIFEMLGVRHAGESKVAFTWTVRILVGKCLSILRLLKATTTFVGGVDYIAWKIERHTGDKIEVSNRLRKYPWIFGWPILIKLILNKSIR